MKKQIVGQYIEINVILCVCLLSQTYQYQHLCLYLSFDVFFYFSCRHLLISCVCFDKQKRKNTFQWLCHTKSMIPSYFFFGLSFSSLELFLRSLLLQPCLHCYNGIVVIHWIWNWNMLKNNKVQKWWDTKRRNKHSKKDEKNEPKNQTKRKKKNRLTSNRNVDTLCHSVVWDTFYFHYSFCLRKLPWSMCIASLHYWNIFKLRKTCFQQEKKKKWEKKDRERTRRERERKDWRQVWNI